MTVGLVAEVAARFGRLDVLVDNAGQMVMFDAMGAMAQETWDVVVGLNLARSFL